MARNTKKIDALKSATAMSPEGPSPEEVMQPVSEPVVEMPDSAKPPVYKIWVSFYWFRHRGSKEGFDDAIVYFNGTPDITTEQHILDTKAYLAKLVEADKIALLDWTALEG